MLNVGSCFIYRICVLSSLFMTRLWIEVMRAFDRSILQLSCKALNICMSLFYHNPTVTKQSQESIHRTMQQTGAKKSDIGEDPVMMGVWSSAGTNAQSRHMVCVVSKHSRRSTRAHHGAVYEQRETCAWAEGKKRIVIPIELVQFKLKQLDFITSFISCIVQTYRKSTHAFVFLLKKKCLVFQCTNCSK